MTVLTGGRTPLDEESNLTVLKQGDTERPIAGMVFGRPGAADRIFQNSIPSKPPVNSTTVLGAYEQLVRSADWTAARIATRTREKHTELRTLERELLLDLVGEYSFSINDDGNVLVAFGEGLVKFFDGAGTPKHELQVEDVRNVWISGDGRVAAISTPERLLLVATESPRDEPVSSASVDDFRISKSGAWQAHVRDRTVSLVLNGTVAASLNAETGLVRDAAFDAQERYFSFVDSKRAYLIDLQAATPTIVHRQQALPDSEYRSTTFGPPNLWGLGSIEIARRARRSSGEMPPDVQPLPNTPGPPFQPGRARVIVQTIDLEQSPLAETLLTWTHWLNFWNNRTPVFRILTSKIYVDTWLALLEGERP